MSTPSSNHNPPVVCTDLTATIAASGTTSGEVDLRGGTLCGIHMPAAFTGTSLSFTVATASGGTFKTLQRNGADYSVPVTQGKYVSLDPSVFAGVRVLKFVSGSAEGADRTLTLATRPV